MNSSSHPWIGRCVGDNQRYRLDRRLGGGGMGDVFLATDTKIGQQVALKLLKDTLVESTEMRQRFEREVTISAALPSEHIVKVSDCGVTPEGYPFYIMEYLRGESLGDLLRRERRLTLDRTIKIISQVCNGLRPAHAGVTLPTGEHIQSVVHRDLKPDNIFLLSTDLGDWVKIVDFGIAKIRNERSEQLTLTNTFLGTLRYSSPEQMMGDKNLDSRADIYSLGVMLYEMLSGADPFGFSLEARHISEASWIVAHATEQPKSLRSQPGCEQLPPAMEAIVMRCLAKDPQARFGSIGELHQALQSIGRIGGAPAPDLTRVQPRIDGMGNPDSIATPLADPAQPPTPAATVQKSGQPPQPEPPPPNATTIPPLEQTSVQSRPDLENLGSLSGESSSLPKTIKTSIEPLSPTGFIPTAQPSAPDQSTQLPSPAVPVSIAPPPTPPQVVPPEATTVQPRFTQPTGMSTPRPNQNLWVKIGAGAVVALGLVGGGIAYFKSQSGAVLDQVASLKQQQKYVECIDRSQGVSNQANDYNQIQEILNQCLLAHAIELKEKSQLKEAIDTAKKISPTSQVYPQAKKYLDDWSILYALP